MHNKNPNRKKNETKNYTYIVEFYYSPQKMVNVKHMSCDLLEGVLNLNAISKD